MVTQRGGRVVPGERTKKRELRNPKVTTMKAGFFRIPCLCMHKMRLGAPMKWFLAVTELLVFCSS